MGEDEEHAFQLLRKNRKLHKSIIKKPLPGACIPTWVCVQA
jgi:hypothetical protein